MSDQWRGQSSPISTARRAVVITPSSDDIPVAKAIIMPAGGDVTVVPVDNEDADTVAFVGVPPGYIVPFQVRRVTAAEGVVVAAYD
jgi:hypothetical protein